MDTAENPDQVAKDKKPFVIKIRWIIIAILAYMLIFNFLLFRGILKSDEVTSSEVSE